MRISDWSSDVCSSDLLDLLDVDRAEYRLEANNAEHRRRLEQVRRAGAIRVVVLDRDADPHVGKRPFRTRARAGRVRVRGQCEQVVALAFGVFGEPVEQHVRRSGERGVGKGWGWSCSSGGVALTK